MVVVGREKPDNPDQSAVRKARASSKDQTNGGLGEGGWGSADNPDQSAVREIRHRNRDRPRREKTREREKGTNQEDEKGGESSADNADQSAVREARHHQGRGSGVGVGQTAERGAMGGQKREGVKRRPSNCVLTSAGLQTANNEPNW